MDTLRHSPESTVEDSDRRSMLIHSARAGGAAAIGGVLSSESAHADEFVELDQSGRIDTIAQWNEKHLEPARDHITSKLLPLLDDPKFAKREGASMMIAQYGPHVEPIIAEILKRGEEEEGFLTSEQLWRVRALHRGMEFKKKFGLGSVPILPETNAVDALHTLGKHQGLRFRFPDERYEKLLERLQLEKNQGSFAGLLHAVSTHTDTYPDASKDIPYGLDFHKQGDVKKKFVTDGTGTLFGTYTPRHRKDGNAVNPSLHVVTHPIQNFIELTDVSVNGMSDLDVSIAPYTTPYGQLNEKFKKPSLSERAFRRETTTGERGRHVRMNAGMMRAPKTSIIPLDEKQQTSFARNTVHSEYDVEKKEIRLHITGPADDMPGYYWTERGPQSQHYTVLCPKGERTLPCSIRFVANASHPVTYDIVIRVDEPAGSVVVRGYDFEDEWSQKSNLAPYWIALPE